MVGKHKMVAREGPKVEMVGMIEMVRDGQDGQDEAIERERPGGPRGFDASHSGSWLPITA